MQRTNATSRHTTSRSTPRAGFSLLELLIALGLGLLLVTALGAALLIYFQAEDASRTRVQRAQLTRALYRRFSDDLRSVIYREAPSEDEESDELSAADDAALEDETTTDEPEVVFEITDPSEAVAGRSMGLVGDSTFLVIHIDRPRRISPGILRPVSDDGATVDETSLAFEGSGLRSVSWFLADSGGSGLASTVAARFASDSGGGGGLIRMDGDRSEMEFADQAADLEMMADRAELLAPEVNFLQFRYFDGLQWTDTWDSNAQERLPNAVEVTLGFRAAEAAETNPYLSSGGSEPAVQEQVRFVISLPLAPAPLLEVQL